LSGSYHRGGGEDRGTLIYDFRGSRLEKVTENHFFRSQKNQTISLQWEIIHAIQLIQGW
jgi:hypothetical protein